MTKKIVEESGSGLHHPSVDCCFMVFLSTKRMIGNHSKDVRDTVASQINDLHLRTGSMDSNVISYSTLTTPKRKTNAAWEPNAH